MIAAPVIQTAGLSKAFGKVNAVSNLNLVVEANRIAGFLGRNGAGKSTTIKMLLGLTRPTEGDGVVLGKHCRPRGESRGAPAHCIRGRGQAALSSHDGRPDHPFCHRKESRRLEAGKAE
jgi:ABC-type sugar transport system ATPase subunit